MHCPVLPRWQLNGTAECALFCEATGLLFDDVDVCLWLQDTCASESGMALRLYKRTDDLTESETRRTSDGTFKDGQSFDVPLHDNNQPYRTISTGLIRIQTDISGVGLADAFGSLGRYKPAFPRALANNSWPAYVSPRRCCCRCVWLHVQLADMGA